MGREFTVCTRCSLRPHFPIVCAPSVTPMSTIYGGFGPGSTFSRSGDAPSTGESDHDFPGTLQETGANTKPPVGCAPDLLRLWQQRQGGQAPQVPAWVERLLKVRWEGGPQS